MRSERRRQIRVRERLPIVPVVLLLGLLAAMIWVLFVSA